MGEIESCHGSAGFMGKVDLGPGKRIEHPSSRIGEDLNQRLRVKGRGLGIYQLAHASGFAELVAEGAKFCALKQCEQNAGITTVNELVIGLNCGP